MSAPTASTILAPSSNPVATSNVADTPAASVTDSLPSSSPDVPTTSAADSNVATSSAPAETTSAAQPTSAQSTPAETQTSTPEATTAAPTSAAPETTSAPAEPTATSTPETSSPVTTSPEPTTPVTDPTTILSSIISTTPISVSSSAPDVTSSSGQTSTASISTSTFVTTITSTDNSDSSATSTESSSTASSTAADSGSGGSGGGMSDGARIAIAVVVPVVAIAGLAAGGLWWWKRRKAQQVAEEERRKEAEDYSYNPNGDPTIPGAVAATDGSYEMRQESNTGYRGWGTTTIGSTGRKASTTLSGPVAVAYSDDTSPSHGAPDARSGDRLLESQADSYSPEGEILGAMGTGAQGQVGDVHRGLSNASSSYSAAGRSDGSGDGNIGVAYSGVVNNQFYDQYGTANPYDVQYQEGYGPNGHGVAGGVSSIQPGELPGQPVIRDNPARRNTRIESPSHFPQQSAGIAQNF
ncbi:hypothetical protein Cpir12675_005652 [Ceratocystis pirilliformis]|uniref:Serine-rich protein n=1 Tax=Ceratocystis pirilliformis TaxID=259994 RepID=A0ABR3YPE5_9PEZI